MAKSNSFWHDLLGPVSNEQNNDLMIIKSNPKSPFRTEKTIHFTISVGRGDLSLPATHHFFKHWLPSTLSSPRMQTAFAKKKENLTLTCPALTPPLLFYNAGGVLNCFAPSFNSAKLILRSEKDRMAGEPAVRRRSVGATVSSRSG